MLIKTDACQQNAVGKPTKLFWDAVHISLGSQPPCCPVQ
jgi:hypothetical protein